MSLMSFKRVLQKAGVPIMFVLAVFMLGGALFSSFGGMTPDPSIAGTDGGANADPNEKPVATVGDLPISRREFESAIEQQEQQARMYGGPAPNAVQRANDRVKVLESFKSKAALASLAKAQKIEPSGDDLRAVRDEIWNTAQKPQVIQQLGLKPDATDRDIDAAIAKQNPQASIDLLKQQYPEGAVREQAAQNALLAKYKNEVTADAVAVKRQYADVKVRHILISTSDGGVGKGLPEGQARTRAEKLLAELKADITKMPALAKQYSDDTGSKTKGGQIDWGPASKYVPEFAQAALDAGVDKLYPQIVQTTYGFHIVKNEGLRPAGTTLPKDFDKNTAKYVDEYKTKIAQGKLGEAIKKTLPTLKVQITDPLLLASQLQIEAQTAMNKTVRDQKLTQAIAELDKVARSSDPTGDALVQKATIYETLENWPNAVKAYNEALDARNSLDTRLALANLQLTQLKDKPNAAKTLEGAVDLPVADIVGQMKLAQMLAQAGLTKLAAEERAEADKMQKRQAAQMQQMIEQMQKQNKASGPASVTLPGGATAVQVPPQATAPDKK